MNLLLTPLRWLHGGSAALRLHHGQVAFVSGALTVRQRQDIAAVCDMHGIASGVVILKPQGAAGRLTVVTYGGPTAVRQQLLNALNC
jgi:hypothetical protein